MKILTIVVAIAFFVVLTMNVIAGEEHHSISPLEPIGQPTYITNTTKNYTDIKGVASAISAANCQFDNGSTALQLCGAVGYYSNQEAVTFGIGKKYKAFLLNGTVSTENGQTAVGMAINWKLK